MTRLNSVLSVDISHLKCFFFVTNRWGCFRNEKVQSFSNTRGLSKDKRAFKMALGADAGI